MNKEQKPTTLLAQKAVMVRLVTSLWSGKKVSKRAKEAIAKAEKIETQSLGTKENSYKEETRTA